MSRGLHRAGHPPDEETALKKSLGTMDRILVILGVFLLLFVVTMTALFIRFQAVPDTLIVSVFGACGVECGIMGAIHNRKTALRARLEELEKTKQEKLSGKEESS